MGRAVGIDLGTTNSVVAYIKTDGQPEVIANREGARTTPSVFAVGSGGENLVGSAAVAQESLNAHNTIRSVKRYMGTDHRIDIGGRPWSPEEVSAEILKKLKSDAEAALGEEVTDAVITVPAYFNNDQRQATKTAGELAGLKVLRIINEPTAAALAYGVGQGKNEKVLVYDLGGGTFDVTVLDITDDGVFDVKATSGNTRLGGDDFDEAMIGLIFSKVESQVRLYMPDECSPTGPPGILLAPRIVLDDEGAARMRDAAESAKKQLSVAQHATINLPYLSFLKGEPVHLKTQVTRESFETAISSFLKQTKICVDSALSDAGLSPSDIDEVVFVGGSTRIPKIAASVEEWVGKRPNLTVNPDEAVAIGAAIQAGILSGEAKRDILLLDVTPLTLGVETLGGVMTAMISRNTTVPTEYTEEFTTAEDSQPQVEVRVYQGERPRVKDNKFLGQFAFTDIPPAPRATPKIDVTFSVDANGILSVSARDQVTGLEQKIVVTGSSSLTGEEIAKMVEDAQTNKETDEHFIAVSEAKDTLRQSLILADTFLREALSALSESVIEELKDARESLADALTTDRLDFLLSLAQSTEGVLNAARQQLRAKAQNETEAN